MKMLSLFPEVLGLGVKDGRLNTIVSLCSLKNKTPEKWERVLWEGHTWDQREQETEDSAMVGLESRWVSGD